MGLDPGALIHKLNKTCHNGLESAAGFCLARTNPSVEVEHWLLKLLDTPNTDLTHLFRQFEVDSSRLQKDLTAAVEGFRRGNSRTPTLSDSVDQ